MTEHARRHILRMIPYGLYVIGLKSHDSYHAFTGSWFSQVSMTPPRVMLGVRQNSHSFELLKKDRVFSVNFLAKKDKKILEQFFKPMPASGNRFGDLGFQIKKTGTPILDDAIAYLECEVAHIYDVGDHSIVVGEVVSAEVLKEEHPLIMSDTLWHYGG